MMLFKRKSSCSYFITRYSDDLLDQIGVKDITRPCAPRQLTPKMSEMIQKILHNPFKDRMKQFHYDNCIRELLFLHFTDTRVIMPQQMTNQDIAAVYHADALLQQNFKVHYTIPQLAEKTGTNEFKLKKGFQAVFQMGVFERLTWHRMEFAKTLLRNTQRTIDDIADEVGYSSRNSFITAFHKNFSVTPKQWRLHSTDSDS